MDKKHPIQECMEKHGVEIGLRATVAQQAQMITWLKEERDELRAQLAEREALLRGLVEYADGLLSDVNDAWAYAGSTGTPESHKNEDYAKAVTLLSASAEPNAPKPRELVRYVVRHDKAQFVVSQLIGTEVLCDPNKTYTFSLYDSDGAPVERDEREQNGVLKLGIYGRAYDQPGTYRAYTYSHQPHNVEASRIGRAAASAKPGGDLIDGGLSLLKCLEAEGFGVFDIAALEPKP